jgi:acyl carrier protein
MDAQELARIVFDTLRRIAPEVEAGTLQHDVPLREQVDLDSMDWLGFLVGLHRQLGVDIPERDYAKLVTLDDLLEYLAARVR